MNFCKNSCLLAGLAIAALGVGAALSQERGDPIGAVTQVGIFDRAQQVKVGKAKTDKPVCYFREQGSRHSVDIGVAADGAFIRLETGDSRETTPQPPLRVFAGKQMAKGEIRHQRFRDAAGVQGSNRVLRPEAQAGRLRDCCQGTPRRCSRWWRAPGRNSSSCNRWHDRKMWTSLQFATSCRNPGTASVRKDPHSG